MSDLCPVYAPFFGAMVSFYYEYGSPDLNLSTSGLYLCHRVYVYVFPLVLHRFPPSTCMLGIGARQVFFFFFSALRVFAAFAIVALNLELIIDFCFVAMGQQNLVLVYQPWLYYGRIS